MSFDTGYDRGYELEIRSTEKIAGDGEVCAVSKCRAEAATRYQVRKVGALGGADVDLCADHDSRETAFDVYEKEASGE